MKLVIYTTLLFSLPLLPAHSELIQELTSDATLIFEDQFDRSETDDSKEELGKQWMTNSSKRANGIKQADLSEGSLVITRAKVADHGVSILHDAPHKDGVFQIRFKIHDKTGIKFNINDPSARKVAHAGHIAGFIVQAASVQIEDHRDGVFNLKIREQAKDKKARRKLIKDRIANFKHVTPLNEWQEIIVVTKSDTSTIYLNNKEIGSLQSSGLSHNTKQNIAFAVAKKATVDWIKVWKTE